MITDLILGTAGHIDHGKTALIGALTGVNTDRLPEEKRRGITIELGFAQLQLGPYHLGIVDVPGHERFVRNMLAGATGMDLAMLVVAADDSVKPQTREHLEVLRLLDIAAGVVVITKCDLVDPEWIGLVESEIDEVTEGTVFADAVKVRTSTVTGAGIDELKDALLLAAKRAALAVPSTRLTAPFRMAVDRSFTIAGHGTVVTGSVSSGTVRVGDELALQPDEITVRVRGVQCHDRSAEQAHRGQRTAINLAGVHHEQIQCGHELAALGHLHPSRLLTVFVEISPDSPRPLKHRQRIRLHVGTAERLASVALMGCETITPGQSGWAQMFLSQPVAVVWNQPFVVRSESPVHTMGGGRVMVPTSKKLRRPPAEILCLLDDLRSPDMAARATAAVFFDSKQPWQPSDLFRAAGIDDPGPLASRLVAERRLIEVAVSHSRKQIVHPMQLDEIATSVTRFLQRVHRREPLLPFVPRARVVSHLEYIGDPALIDATLQRMAKSGAARVTPMGLATPDHGPQLTKNEQRQYDDLIQLFAAQGFQPPTVGECRQQAARAADSVKKLIELAAMQGELVKINSDIYLHQTSFTRLLAVLRAELTDGKGLTVSQLRELLDTSRKYAVPICEYLDREGYTQRQGDVRVRGTKEIA
ncbi:MAG: selenocysteine-specific translation elongation factor [Pirellulaceae bacterium]|nr:selenocysteine-specific translation elongation factor [Planctomycetales bacterium]